MRSEQQQLLQRDKDLQSQIQAINRGIAALHSNNRALERKFVQKVANSASAEKQRSQALAQLYVLRSQITQLERDVADGHIEIRMADRRRQALAQQQQNLEGILAQR